MIDNQDAVFEYQETHGRSRLEMDEIDNNNPNPRAS